MIDLNAWNKAIASIKAGPALRKAESQIAALANIGSANFKIPRVRLSIEKAAAHEKEVVEARTRWQGEP